MKHRLASLAALAVSAVSIAACGSSTSSTSSGASSSVTSAAAANSGGSSGLAAAEAAVATATKAPAPINRPVLTKKPPAGKSIVYVSCPVQTCTAVQKGLVAGTKALGWKLTVIQGGIDPQTQNAGWTQAVQAKPDGIVGITTVPYAALSQPFAAAAAAKIPIVTIAGDGVPHGSVISNLVSPKAESVMGTVMADWVAVDSKGKANVALFNDPSNPSFNATTAAYKAELAKVCSGCKVSVVKYSTLDIGKNVPGQVVSYVQQNPNVNYVGFTLGDAAIGVPQALQAAGLSGKVKIFSRAAVPPNTADIAKGLEAMSVGEELTSLSWESLDSLARHFVGDSVSACCGLPAIEHQILTKANVSTLGASPAAIWQVPEVPQTFAKIWHLG